MNIQNMMQIFSMIAGMKDKLLKYGVSPEEIAQVNFNNPADIENFAKKVMPSIIKNNPQIASGIKQMAGMLGDDKAKEVCEVIDMN